MAHCAGCAIHMPRTRYLVPLAVQLLGFEHVIQQIRQSQMICMRRRIVFCTPRKKKPIEFEPTSKWCYDAAQVKLITCLKLPNNNHVRNIHLDLCCDISTTKCVAGVLKTNPHRLDSIECDFHSVQRPTSRI